MKAGQDGKLQNGKTLQARQAENNNHNQGIRRIIIKVIIRKYLIAFQLG